MNYINLTPVIGEKLKHFRENSKISIEAMSSAAGIGISTLERFEEGLSSHCLTETFKKIVDTCAGQNGIPAFVKFSLKTGIEQSTVDLDKTRISLENMVNSAYDQDIPDKFRRDISFLLNKSKKEAVHLASLYNENEKDVVEMRKMNSAFSPNAIVRVVPAKTWGIYYNIDAKEISDILSGKTTKSSFVVLSRIMSCAWKLDGKEFDQEGMKNYGLVSYDLIKKQILCEEKDSEEKEAEGQEAFDDSGKVLRTAKKKSAAERISANGIGVYLKDFRESRGVSQVAVAKALGRSRGWLQNVEQLATGCHLYVDQVEKIADIISPEEGVSAFLRYAASITVERGILPSEENIMVLTRMADSLKTKVPKLLQTHMRNKIEKLKISEGSVAGVAKVPPKAIGRILHETGYETKASFLFRILTFLYKKEGALNPEEKAKSALAGAEINYFTFTSASKPPVKPDTADIHVSAALKQEHTPVKTSAVVKKAEERKEEPSSLADRVCAGELGSILSHLETMSGLGKDGYGTKGIKAISRNFEADAGLMFAYGQIDISPVCTKSKETKQEFLNALKELVKEYGKKEENTIDYYIV